MMISNANISARRIPRQHRSRQTVEDVLAAVPLVIKRYGAASITTNHIAEVAGVSIGSLYQYFPDKGAIFSALHERHVGETRRILEQNIATHTTSTFSESVVDLVEELVDIHCAESELHQVISTSINEGPEQFRLALRATLESSLVRNESKNTNRLLYVLPSLIEGVVHGAILSKSELCEAKAEAIKATVAYLSYHPELC
jgi:AcrR family transcriptional regulator